jgi:UDP:flavonoid glycosyltransferase YjiC (YdhE family)
MRILFSAGPMYGHVNPVLPLALAAHAAGHETVLATGSALVPHVERHGLAAWALPAPEAPGAVTDWFAHFVAGARERSTALVPRAVDWKPDLVVHEETELAGAVAARVTGARHVVHGLGLMPPVAIWPAYADALDERFAAHGVPCDAVTVRDATYVDICPPALRPPGERIWPRTRPMRPGAGIPGPDERLPAAIDRLPYDRTVHLTLGTVFHDAVGVLAEAIAGLRTLPVNLVVTTGPGSDPERFGPQPPHVLVAPYLPHTLLLPRCDLVVAHGGAGVMLGALAHGLPQLILPQGAEQHGNAAACARAGAALSLAPGEATAAAVTTAAKRLLDEPAFAARAGAIRTEILAAPGPDEVLADLVAER